MSNPASRVKPPKVPKKIVDIYDDEQVKVLLAAADKETLKHKILINLALFTGLRRGEIMGLQWTDINLSKGSLEVRRASQYISGQGQFTKAPKNETSERLMSLPPFLVDMLKQYKKEQTEERLKINNLWQGSDRLFTTWDGKPGHPEWPSQWFPKFLKRFNLKEGFHNEIKRTGNRLKAQELIILEKKYLKLISENSKASKEQIPLVENSIISLIGKDGLERIKQNQTLPPLPFHGLRHINATMLINTGLPLKSISGRMGHSNIDTTLNIYGHYLKSADKEAADRLEAVYHNLTGEGKKEQKKERI